MRIEIDDDVFAFLQKQAKPFIEHTPNSTLRRLLGIDRVSTSAKPQALSQTATEELDGRLTEGRELVRSRSKARKADLEDLVRAGLVRNGEKLHFIDYKGNRVQKGHAVISGSHLIYNGRPYSMSKLARELLTKIGFKTKAAPGPAHWVTEEGKSIRDLWQQLQAQR